MYFDQLMFEEPPLKKLKKKQYSQLSKAVQSLINTTNDHKSGKKLYNSWENLWPTRIKPTKKRDYLQLANQSTTTKNSFCLDADLEEDLDLIEKPLAISLYVQRKVPDLLKSRILLIILIRLSPLRGKVKRKKVSRNGIVQFLPKNQ
jgi:hypothetical protein